MRRPFLREDELGGRLLRDVGADGPALVVEVELRRHRHQVHVGFVVGVERAHVAPVARLLGVEVAEIVGDHAAVAAGMRGITSLPKSWEESGSCASSCSARSSTSVLNT